MGRIFITGAADGLGRETARRLAAAGHEVVVHARSDARVQDARTAVPGAIAGVAGDLTSLEETHALAERAQAEGPYDAVVHNAGLYVDDRRTETVDGLPRVFQVNVLAPYVLTALMAPPKRLVYLSSGLHRGGTADLTDLAWRERAWRGSQAYADSKLLDVVLAFAVARRWAGTTSSAVDPGWVRTKMGGPGAARGLTEGTDTQVWLAAGEVEGTEADGRYFVDRAAQDPRPEACDTQVQDGLLAACAELSGVELA